MRHTLILSDLHLWQATDHDDLWMRYRHRRFIPDTQLAALIESIYAQIGSAPLELVLNGDIFDFDIPPVVDGHAAPAAAPRTSLAARTRLAAILDDHELFVEVLARVIQRGDRVVFISGNHDIQMSLPGVRNYLVERLINKLRILFPQSRDYRAYERVLFRAWYYQTSDGVHIEHGNQYDVYCSVSDPTAALSSAQRLRPNAGGLVIEHLIGHLGYFNPNVDSTFLLTTREYLAHWQTYYRSKPRSLVGTWFFGSLRIVWELGRSYGFWRPRSARAPSHPAFAENESRTPQQEQHAQLFALPDARAAMRLLCIDRALLGLLLLGALALAGVSWILAAALLVMILGLWYALQKTAAPANLGTVADQIQHSARAIARIYRARAVVFGHTHKASGVWEEGVFYGNSGTWAPLYHDVACTIAIEAGPPLIWLRAEAAQLSGGLYRFHGGQLHPETEPQIDPVVPAASAVTRRRLPQAQLESVRLLM